MGPRGKTLQDEYPLIHQDIQHNAATLSDTAIPAQRAWGYTSALQHVYTLLHLGPIGLSLDRIHIAPPLPSLSQVPQSQRHEESALEINKDVQ